MAARFAGAWHAKRLHQARTASAGRYGYRGGRGRGAGVGQGGWNPHDASGYAPPRVGHELRAPNPGALSVPDAYDVSSATSSFIAALTSWLRALGVVLPRATKPERCHISAEGRKSTSANFGASAFSVLLLSFC